MLNSTDKIIKHKTGLLSRPKQVDAKHTKDEHWDSYLSDMWCGNV